MTLPLTLQFLKSESKTVKVDYIEAMPKDEYGNTIGNKVGLNVNQMLHQSSSVPTVLRINEYV